MPYWVYHLLTSLLILLGFGTYLVTDSALAGILIPLIGFTILTIVYMVKNPESVFGSLIKWAGTYGLVFAIVVLGLCGGFILLAKPVTQMFFAGLSTIDGSHGASNPLNRDGSATAPTEETPTPPAAPAKSADNNGKLRWKPKLNTGK